MKKIKTFFVLMVVATISMSMAQSNWVGMHNNTPSDAEIKLLESNVQQTQIQFSVDGYFEKPVRTPRGTEKILTLDNGIGIAKKGMPDLGKLYTSIIIPDTEQMQVKVVSYKYQEIENVGVAPSKGHFTRDINPGDVPFEYGDAYNEDAFWPAEIARLEDPFIMRDFRGQTVTIFPLQYNPVTQTLRVYTDITVEISATGEQGKNILSRKSDQVRVEHEFGQIYDRFFLNMDAADKSYQLLEGEEGSMLIIAYDDFVDAMQPFVNWKRTSGRVTEIVPKSEVGFSASEIQEYVANYYEENEDFAHLLLVGDGPQIPVVNASGGQSDVAYGFIQGDDSYNDIFVGRFSAETVEHVETHVQRMIEYERDITEEDTWLSTGMGIARNEGAGGGHNGGEADYEHMDYIKDTLRNYTYDVVHKHYDHNVPNVPNTNPAAMSASFNEGASIANYCNHGSTTGWSVGGYSISHVNDLTNVGKLPFIWSVACVNGAFVNNFCFAEAWLRATHEGEPSGAIGMMAATINQLWQPPMTGQDEMVTLLTEQSTMDHETLQRTFGGLSINGSMSMIPAHGTAGINTHQTWVLFGDPSLKVRTAAPTPVEAMYNPVMLIGTPAFEITVENAEGATVALSYYDEAEGEVELLGKGFVEGGMANVEFEEALSEPATLTLTITGFNKVTYINDDIQVIPPDGPYLVFDEYIIDDSAGNNNNQADYGETILLDVALKNVGIDKAENVEAVLTTESDYISIIDGEQLWGDLEEDESAMMEAAFAFEVNEVIPDNHSVIFNLQITGYDEEEEMDEWESNFSLRIYSPMFSIDEFVVDDSEYGEGNGRLDPGETADILVKYHNVGGAPANAPKTGVHAANPYLSIENPVVEPGAIQPGEYVQVAYTVHAHESTIEGTIVDLLFSVEDAHHVESDQLLVIGQLPEDQIGDGGAESGQYPFYNFYKANRSQMIYTSDELGAGEKTITEIGFDIIQASSEHNNLPNFKIRMMHIEEEVFDDQFVNTDEAQVVFSADAYQMPGEEGWHFWEIDPFEYGGEGHLLIEIAWGLLDQWTSNHYVVASTHVNAERTAYGYNDWNAVPDFSGTSAVRPNVFFTFEAQVAEEDQLVAFHVVNQLDEIQPEADIMLGSYHMQVDEEGKAGLSIQPGSYLVSAMAPGHADLENYEVIVEPGTDNDNGDDNGDDTGDKDNNDDNGDNGDDGDNGDNGDEEETPDMVVELVLTKLFDAHFEVSDNYGAVVTDAVITLEEQNYEEGHYAFESLLPGTYNFTVSREFYFDYEGEFDLVDGDETISVVLEADGTDVQDVAEGGINAYPNPFNNMLYLDLPAQVSGELQIVDVLGNVVYHRADVSGSQNLDLAFLPVGNYLLRITHDEETRVIKVSRVE